MTTNDLVSATNCSFALHREGGTATFVPNPLKDAETSSIGINLRKRSVDDGGRGVVMSSYNSAFLSGLFADIAKANNGASVSEAYQDEDPRLDPCMPNKKSRSTITRSISRCGKSFCDLSKIPRDTPPKTDNNPATSPATVSPDQHFIPRYSPSRSALSGELHCVSSASSNESEAHDLGKLAFPQLPATISNPSCNTSLTLTRKDSSCQQSLDTEKIKESYGWFVEMDDDDDATMPPPKALPCSVSTEDLAFVAATAPKRVNYDAEVEWAKAADTVDDVLGDFF